MAIMGSRSVCTVIVTLMLHIGPPGARKKKQHLIVITDKVALDKRVFPMHEGIGECCCILLYQTLFSDTEKIKAPILYNI